MIDRASASLWNPSLDLILASKSASRRSLLEAARLPFSVQLPKVDERAIEAEFEASTREAGDLASLLARAKAIEVSERFPGSLCLGADQVLCLNDEVFHKPGNRAEAAAHISRLSGKTHVLTSAFAIARDGAVIREGVDRAKLTMRTLEADDVELYVRLAGDAILASVGAYQLESLGIHLFERIEGDHTTILGLPMLKLLQALRAEGALLL